MTREQDGEKDQLGKQGLRRRSALICGIAVAVAAAMFLIACGGGSDDETAQADQTVSSTEPETKPDKITIRSWGDPYRAFWRDTAGKKFTEDTGVKVEWDTTDTGELLTRIRAADDAGQRPPVDAVMGEGVLSYLALAQGLTVELDPEVAPNLNELNPALAQVGLDTPEWSMLGMWAFSAPINYRTDKVKDPSALESWEGLWGPQFKNSIMLPTTYQAFTFTTARLLGIDPATDDMGPVWDKIAELKPNLVGVGGDTEVVSGLISGDVGATVALPANGDAAAKEGAPIDFAVPKEGMFVDRDFYWLVKGAPPEVEYYTKLFANYMADVGNQTTMAKELGVIPTHPDAKLPQYMVDNPTVYPVSKEDVEKNVLVPLQLAAEKQDEWQAAYDQAVK